MLIEFSVKNFRSIKDKATLSMTPVSRLHTEKSRETFKTNNVLCPNLLKSAGIFGPNAGGKTTLFAGLGFCKSMVMGSAQVMQQGQPIPINAFHFNSKTRKEPSEFHIAFIEDNILFEYDFSTTSERIVHESLVAYPNGKAQLWFDRSYDLRNQNYTWKFGSFFRGNKEAWKIETRENGLFLSLAVQRNSEMLKPVFHWFANRLFVLDSDQMNTGISKEACMDAEKREKITRFMNEADFRIDKIEPNSTDVFQYLFFPKLSSNEEALGISLGKQSDGTKKLFFYSMPWINLIEQDLIFAIDEFDVRLHPLLQEFLIKKFHRESNKAQLIFITHNTHLQKYLSRDQVWFVDKNKAHETELYSLAEFKGIKTEHDIEKRYLRGKYGATPYISELIDEPL